MKKLLLLLLCTVVHAGLIEGILRARQEDRDRKRGERLKKLALDEEGLSKLNQSVDYKYELLALPDDVIWIVLFEKIDTYIRKKKFGYDSEKKIVRFCNLMAHTCRRMNEIIKSDLFVIHLVQKLLGERPNPTTSFSCFSPHHDLLLACSQYYFAMLLERIVTTLKSTNQKICWDIMMFNATLKKDTRLLEYLKELVD